MDKVKSGVALIDLQLTGSNIGIGSINNPPHVQSLLCNALKEIGFVYLTNHGITQEKISRAFEVSSEFFSLPQSTKNNTNYTLDSEAGYDKLGNQALGENRLTECKESYDRVLCRDVYPAEVPEFKNVTNALIDDLVELGTLVLQLLEDGIGLPPNTLTSSHKNLYEEGNLSKFKMIHYPAVTTSNGNNVRCGAHTDFGTITLLLQDDAGGLRARNRKGEWIDAEPMPGTIALIMGDLIEIWTGGELKAVEHSVPTPRDSERSSRSRYSMALFFNTDKDVIVEPKIGNKKKYKSVTGINHTFKRLQHSYA